MAINISIRCIQYSENSQSQLHKLHETEGRIYALENYAIIGSGNSMSTIRLQAIVWIKNGDLLTV